MNLEQRLFKCRGSNTIYKTGFLHNGNFPIHWTNSSGESREDFKTVSYIENMVKTGDWYFIDQVCGATVEVPTSKVKSDGGSSSYYELTITNKAGESIKCETGDVIRALVGNDFDFGNCVKALRRMYLATLGKGKEGTDIPYDCNKVRYFLSEIERVNK